MHAKDLRADFYASRLTRDDLTRLAIISSKAICDCDESGRTSHFWRWVFESMVAELGRRVTADQAIAAGDVPAEQLPIDLPLWRGSMLGDALQQAFSLVYIDHSPGCAAFADWIGCMLMLRATVELKSHSEEKNHA
jgi:hypothetical protein